MPPLRAWRHALLPLLLTGAAAAEPAPLETAALSWVRAENAASCPGAADMARAIEQRIGRQALVPADQAGLIVEAYVEAVPAGGFHVSIALTRDGVSIGRRELESAEPTCQAIAEKAALVIALTIDPDAALEGAPIELIPPAAPPLLPPPSQPTPKPVAPPEPRPVRPSAEPQWQGDVELAAGIATAIVPDVAPGIFGRGRALPPELPLAVELEGAYFPPTSLESSPGKGAELSVFYAGLSLCSRAPRATAIRAFACAGGEVGAVAGEGYGFDSTPRFRTWTFTLAARGRLGFRVTHGFAVVLGPDLWVPLKRDSFEVEPVTGTEELFRMSALGLGFELGFVWEL